MSQASQGNSLTANWKPLRKTPPFVDNEEKRLMKLVDEYRDFRRLEQQDG